jgi:hypothetical protein
MTGPPNLTWKEALQDAEGPETHNQFSQMHGRNHWHWKIPIQKGKNGGPLVAQASHYQDVGIQPLKDHGHVQRDSSPAKL